jgi:hypothetical protein
MQQCLHAWCWPSMSLLRYTAANSASMGMLEVLAN